LIRSQDFVDCKARGKRRGSQHLTVWFKRNEQGFARLGLAVARQVGKAHDRNRFKRRVRELFRRGLVPFREGYDYVVVARAAAPDLALADLQAELTGLLSERMSPRRPPQ
jgi:ribonuclease P protein component